MVGAIFDVDGTLLDSMWIWVEVDRIYLARHNIEATEEISRKFFNMTLERSIKYMQEELGIKDDAARIKHDLLKIVEDFYLHEVGLKPHIKEIIETFKKKHIPMVIATSNTKSLIEKALERLGILDDFAYILTCDEAGCDKNTPHIYELATHYTSSKPENTYVFEDALHAATSAHKGNFKVVGIYDEYSKDYKEKLQEVSDFYLESDEDYERFMKRL